MLKSPSSDNRIVIVGGGVAGSEVGTLLGQRTSVNISVTEIEADPQRKFGGWGFQRFPGESTNLALRKMYLSEDPDEILRWAKDPLNRIKWPTELREITLDPDRVFPRALVQEYVAWRRHNVRNDHISYTPVTGEAVRAETINNNTEIQVTLSGGKKITGDKLVMASGSIAVKVPNYLQPFAQHDRVIVDPLTKQGDTDRHAIPQDAKVLVLGTGLTAEEQLNILLKKGHKDVTLLSRQGKLHYVYPKQQHNKPLEISEPPDFLFAETPEEFVEKLEDFYAKYMAEGHTPEDILGAIRPHWEETRKKLGRCAKAVERLRAFQRDLATNSIGTSFEVAANTREAEKSGYLKVLGKHIKEIRDRGDHFDVDVAPNKTSSVEETLRYDFIINAIGRTIIRHPIWEQLLSEGYAKKHASIGVQVSETGQMIMENGTPSDMMYVVGMPRAGDHTFRSGYLGNTAFNVPMVRAHVGNTVDAILKNLGTPVPQM